MRREQLFTAGDKSPWLDTISIQKYSDGKAVEAIGLENSCNLLYLFFELSRTGHKRSDTTSEKFEPGRVVLAFGDHSSRVSTGCGYRVVARVDLLKHVYKSSFLRPILQFLSYLTEPVVQIQLSQNDRFEAEWLLCRIYSSTCEQKTLSASVYFYFGELLLLCYRNWNVATIKPPGVSATGEFVVRRLRDYIDKHYLEELTLKELAEKAGYAPSYFSSLFSKTMGQGIFEYLSARRIAVAQELLSTKSSRVIDICYSAGFHNLGHFYRVFKKCVGVSPNRYRRLVLSRTPSDSSVKSMHGERVPRRTSVTPIRP